MVPISQHHAHFLPLKAVLLHGWYSPYENNQVLETQSYTMGQES